MYGKAGQLLKDETYTYTYDEQGNLTAKESPTEKWYYHWAPNGLLKRVIRPDQKEVSFTYDALGRRLIKTFEGQTTHFVWDGNVLLHEWMAPKGEPLTRINEKGEQELKPPKSLTTWVFEDGTFVPIAKLVDGRAYSIITDHLGTPSEMYDEQGKRVWLCQLDIYSKVRQLTGERSFIPFRYQEQYANEETGLYYESVSVLFAGERSVYLTIKEKNQKSASLPERNIFLCSVGYQSNTVVVSSGSILPALQSRHRSLVLLLQGDV